MIHCPVGLSAAACRTRASNSSKQEIVQRHVPALEGPFVEVDVRVHKSRHHQPALEIDLFRIRPGQILHVLVRADGQNAAPGNGKGRCRRLPLIRFGNAAVEKNAVGR
jgi:hypothetical protein